MSVCEKEGMCVRERERERGSVSVCVCVCARVYLRSLGGPVSLTSSDTLSP